MMKHKPNFKAYTMIELVLVIILFGTLIVVALPILARYNRTVKLEMAAKVLITNLQKARLLAVTQNCRYRIYFDVPGNRYFYKVDYNNSRRIDPEEETPQFYYLPGDITYNCTGVKGPPSRPRKTPSYPVTFRHRLMSVGPEGRWSNPGSIYLGTTADDRMAITVNIAGVVRLWDWDVDCKRWIKM